MRKTATKILSVFLVGSLVVLAAPAGSPQAAKKPSLSKKNVSLVKGSSKRLSVKNKKGYTVTWKSGKKSVITVTKNGLIRAKRKGTAKVFAVVKNKVNGKSRKLSCQIAVKEKANLKTAAPANKVAPAAKTDSVEKTVPAVGKDSVEELPGNPEEIPKVTDPVTPAPTSTPHDIVPKPEFVVTNPVDTENAKMLYSQEIDYGDLHVKKVLGTQIITSYEQLQTLIQSAKDEVAGNPEIKYEFTDIIRQMEAIDREYFIENALCVGTLDYGARGYGFTVASSVIKQTKQGDIKQLNILLDQYWALPDDACTTCDAVYYGCLIQMPKDTVQDCHSLVCGLSQQ